MTIALEQRKAKLAEEKAKKEEAAEKAAAAAAEAKRLLQLAQAEAAKKAKAQAAKTAKKQKNKNKNTANKDKVDADSDNPEDYPEEQEPDEATTKAAEVSQQAHLAEETSMAELAAATENTQQSTEELKAAQKSYQGTLVREEKKLVHTHTHTHTHAHSHKLASFNPLHNKPHTQPHTHTRAQHRLRLGAGQGCSITTGSRTRGRTTKP